MIGIITPGNLKYTPYIQNYISILNDAGYKYLIMSWNKRNIYEEGVDMRFDYSVDDSNRKKMLWGYINFIAACKKFINANSIDKLIILTYAPAFFLGPFLNNIRYIVDIRDDSPLIRHFNDIFLRITNKADYVIVSSPMYAKWLNRKSVLCHNADLKLLKKYKDFPCLNHNNEAIRIVFAGTMIESEKNIEILGNLGNDKRFLMTYIGRPGVGIDKIHRYIIKNDIKNVFFHGTYSKEEIIDIYRTEADLVNILRKKSIVNKNALPNKFYESVISGIPLLVFEHNEAIVEYTNKFGLGLVLKDKPEVIGSQIITKLNCFDYEAYKHGRKLFLTELMADMEAFKETIELFLQQKPNF